MYKKISLLVLACCFTLFANGQSLKGSTWAETQKKGSGNIVISYYETPNLIEKTQGRCEGVCADIMESFVTYLKKTKKMSVTISYKDGDKNFKSFYAGIKNGTGGVFGLGNVTITPERKKEVAFSTPFMTNVAILVTQKSAPALNRIKDMSSTFKGMRAFVAKGTTHDKVMASLKEQYYPDMVINYTTSSKESLEMVLKDEKAFCYQDLVVYFDALEDKQPIKRHSIADRSGEEFGIVMPLKSDWAPVFDDFMSKFVKSEEYRTILKSHLGADALKIMDSVKK